MAITIFPLRLSAQPLATVGCALFLVTGWAHSPVIGPVPQADLTAEEVLAKVRQAANYDSMPQSVLIQGTVKALGTEGTYTLLSGKSGPYVQRFNLPSISSKGQSSGFDGKTFWAADWSGATVKYDPSSGDERRFYTDSQTMGWLDKSRPYKFSVVKGDKPESVFLQIATEDGLGDARVEIDSSTWLPRQVTVYAVTVNRVVTLSDFRPEQGVVLPHAIASARGGPVDYLNITSVQRVEPAKSDFAMPNWKPDDVEFDNSKPAELETITGPHNHMLVHPLVDGKDVGWFVLDSGSGGMNIDTGVAKELGLESFGEFPVAGVNGITKGHYARVSRFTLGRGTFKNMLFAQVDLQGLGLAPGVKLAGIIGFDVFRRAIIEIEPAKRDSYLYDPAGYKLRAGKWQQLVLANRTPAVMASFGDGHRGFFRLDSGASHPMIFHSPTVAKYDLTKGIKLEDDDFGGIGGSAKAKAGPFPSVTLGGHRFENVWAIFSNAKTGSTADKYLLGNIGQPLLQPFRIVFDYPHDRIAFVPRELVD